MLTRLPWLLILPCLLATSCRKADESAPTAAAPEIITTQGGLEMVRIPAGRFQMGSANGKEDEAPVREVAIAAFLMDRHEMTQAHFVKHVPVNGSHFKGPDRPVEMISWGDAALFCNKRSRAEGFNPCYDEDTGECNFTANGYRLPTEAEWEYACRAGAAGDYYFGADPRLLSQYAWYADNADKQTKPVGKKKPNAWGLYDMLGNVAEWCNDVYQADYYRSGPAADPRGPSDGERRVLRGGAWNSKPDACRSAIRVGETPGFQDACFARDAIGFRCVRRENRQ
jgi:formylglycine-generating enzyme required for sulfatase activity